VPVILNLSSGNAEDRKTIESLSEVFRAAGAEADVQRAASGEEVVELARRAASGRSDVVAVGGGDGTLSSAASVLAGGPKALGVLPLVLTLDGHEIRRRTPYVFVGNNAYDMEGFDIGTRDHLDRSELSVYLAHSARPLDLVLLGLRALIGRARKSPMFESLTTRALRIETRRERVPVATDGELTIFETPLVFRVRPKALRVIVPLERNREPRR
jgi:diacylglycerol kinase family enzyme